MKKIFTLIATAVFALSANAIEEGTYSFAGLSASDFTITNSELVAQDAEPASKATVSYTYDATGKTADFAGVTVKGISFTIKNSGKKASHFRALSDAIFVNGGFTLTIPGVEAGKVVTVNASTDKSGATITPTGATADADNATMGSAAADFKFTADGGDVVLVFNVALKVYSVAVGAAEEGGNEGGNEGGEEGGETTEGDVLFSYANGAVSVGSGEVFNDASITEDKNKCVTNFSVKYDGKSTSASVITFPKSITTTTGEGDAKVTSWTQYYKVAGDFKAGDVITIQPFTQMSETDKASKYANITLYNADKKKVADLTDSAVGALTVTNNDEAGAPKEFNYTLTEDLTDLYFGRAGGTRINLLSLKVERPTATAISAIEAAEAAPAVKKVVKDGKLVIISGGKTYNAAGQEVK